MKQFISLEEAVDKLQSIEGRDEQISFLESVKILDIVHLSKEISETEKALENCKNLDIPQKLVKRQKETELHLENKLKVLRLIQHPKEKILITREKLREIEFSDNEKIFLDAITRFGNHNDMAPYLLMLLQEKFPNNTVEITYGELYEIWWKLPLNIEGENLKINRTKLEETAQYNKKPWENMDSFSVEI